MTPWRGLKESGAETLVGRVRTWGGWTVPQR